MLPGTEPVKTTANTHSGSGQCTQLRQMTTTGQPFSLQLGTSEEIGDSNFGNFVPLLAAKGDENRVAKGHKGAKGPSYD